MRSNRFPGFCCCLVFAICSPDVLPGQSGGTLLSAGTPVCLEIASEIEASEAFEGQIVALRVRSNVTFNGKVLVAAGTEAEAMVVGIKRQKRKPSTLIILAESATATDGQRVSLTSPHVEFKISGKDTAGLFGELLSARVLNDVRVR